MKSVFEETICQLCLQVDIKVYKISDLLHVFIESILKLNDIHYVPSENLSICPICMALLTKTFNFVQTVWKAQEIIYDMLGTNDLITKSSLRSLDRHKMGLNPLKLRSDTIISENEVIIYDIDRLENLNNSCLDIDIDVDQEEHKSLMSGIETFEVSSGEEDFKDLNECNETASGIAPENDNDNTEDPLLSVRKSNHDTINLGTIECDNTQTTPIKQKKKIVIPKKKKKEIKYKIDEIESESSTEEEKQQLKKDADYRPVEDSTSHSEDSAYDDYDDNGKKIKKPKHGLAYPRKCDNCNYEVPEHKLHFRHYLFMHPGIKYPYESKKTHICPICGKLFTRKLLKIHERSHTGENVKCPKCPKTFATRSFMLRHKFCVHPKMMLICDYCSKEFKTRSDLTRHLRIHEGVKPFKCHICDAAFAHSGNRIIHIRSAHQNIRYVPKKRVNKPQKARSKNKQETPDTDMSSANEAPIKRKKSNFRKKSETNKGLEKKSKRMKKKNMSGDKKNMSKGNALHTSPEIKGIGSESDDELLSEIKSKIPIINEE